VQAFGVLLSLICCAAAGAISEGCGSFIVCRMLSGEQQQQQQQLRRV
jgi:hypothetical protein